MKSIFRSLNMVVFLAFIVATIVKAEDGWQEIKSQNYEDKSDYSYIAKIEESNKLATQIEDYNSNSAKSPKKKKLDLFVGEVKVVGKVDVTRVAVGNGAIIRAEVLKSGELLVIAKTAGSSSLLLWHKDGNHSDYNIRVSELDPERRFPIEKMVRMKVKMVEFRKSALGQLGIDWSDNIAGPSFATVGDVIGNNLFRPESNGFSELPNTVKPFSTYFGIASNITSRINFMASNGDAVTLAEPVLSCVNGGTANFLAGGEVPYSTSGANGETNIGFKDYGIKLDIAPEIDANGNVRTLVKTEISQLDPAISVQGTPGLLTRRAQTQVNVRSGETIVISGLLSAEKSNEESMFPVLGELPIIGALFKTKGKRETTTELVIFVTPVVIDSDIDLVPDTEEKIYSYSSHVLSNLRKKIPIME